MLTPRSQSGRFLLVFLPPALVVTLVTAVFWWLLVDHARSKQESDELAHVQLAQTISGKGVVNMLADLRVLAKNLELAKWVLERDEIARPRLAEDFRRFLEAKLVYDQVRVLDADGFERLRIDYRGGRALASHPAFLQDKSDSPYFKAIMQLEPGDVYMSPLNLNREEGVVEVPLKPVIRVGVPFADNEGRKVGALVLTYLASHLLDDIAEALRSAGGETMLLNGQGYWMMAPDSEATWGMDLGHQRSFAREFPEAWQQIGPGESGVFRSGGDLFAYATAYPVEAASEHVLESESVRWLDGNMYLYQWKIVTRLTALGTDELSWTFSAILATLLLVVCGGSLFVMRSWNSRQSALQALATSEVRFRDLIEGSIQGIIIHVNRSLVFANEAAADIFGYASVNRLLSVPSVLDLIVPEERDKVAAVLNDSHSEDGERSLYEFRGVRPDGAKIWMQCVLRDVQWEGQQATQGTISDITDRREAWLRLKQSEASLADAQRLAQLGSWEWNIAANRTTWSQEVYQICGFEPGSIEPSLSRFTSIVLPADRAQVEQAFDESLRHGAELTQEVRLLRPSGEERRVRTQWVTERGADGRAVRMSGTLLDVTELRQVEDELARFKTTLDLTQDCIFMFDKDDLRFFYVNEGATAQVGYSRDELLTLGPVDIKPHTDEAEFRKLIAPLVQQMGGSVVFETVHGHKDGHEIPVEISLQYVAPPGEEPRFVAMVRDITERLETQAALMKAKDEAEAAARAKSEFLANMSHEIRTPMNGVLGMLELLSGTQLADNQRHYVETATSSAQMQLSVINDILDFSKIEAGKMHLETLPFDPGRTAERTASVLAEQARGKGLGLFADIAADVPLAVRGDPARLRQILLNLAGNAVKFTAQGEVVIRAVHEKTEAETVWLRFDVIDTGIGIPPEALRSLFNPFSQADSSTTRRFGGTGLGLTISRELSELMGGRLEVESVEGLGSTFSAVLPFGRVESPRHAVAELAGLKVLVVDTQQTNVFIVGNYLKSWGARPEVCRTGDEALKLLRGAGAEPFRLVVLDRDLPGQSGAELARAIGDDRALHAPLIVLLTSSQLLDEEELRHAGIAAQLSKPVVQSDLFDTVNYLIHGGDRENLTPLKPRPSGALTQYRARVLLVEDAVVNQQVAAGLLARQGIDAEIAENGRVAFEKTGDASYDLVFMDVMMPEMDGLEATSHIRRREAARGLARLPIIAMTANAMEGDREQCLSAGMDDYIAKPLNTAELSAVLERWAGHTVAAAETETGAAAAPPKGATATAEAVAAPAQQAARGATHAVDSGSFDAAVLDRLKADLESVPGGLERIVKSFLDDTPALLRQIDVGLQEASAEACRRPAHNLKSTAATLGAAGLSTVAKTIEQQTREGSMENVEGLLAQAREEFSRVEDSLRLYLET